MAVLGLPRAAFAHLELLRWETRGCPMRGIRWSEVFWHVAGVVVLLLFLSPLLKLWPLLH